VITVSPVASASPTSSCRVTTSASRMRAARSVVAEGGNLRRYLLERFHRGIAIDRDVEPRSRCASEVSAQDRPSGCRRMIVLLHERHDQMAPLVGLKKSHGELHVRPSLDGLIHANGAGLTGLSCRCQRVMSLRAWLG
jgi:hypothetical protein